MLKSMLIFCTMLFMLLFSAAVQGATKNKQPPVPLHNDTAKISVKKFNKQAIDKYRTDEDFNYKSDPEGGRPSLWTRFWIWVWYIITWLWRKIFAGIDSIPHGGQIFTYTLLAAAVGFLVYVILKSAGIDASRLFRGSGEKIGLPYSESLENIHDINFDQEIERAISQHDFRLAVRLLYLKCLKQLSDSHLIDWQIDKTNSAYLVELTDAIQKQKFGLLTRQFEYVWYGNFPIDQQAFGSIFSLFQDFKKQLP